MWDVSRERGLEQDRFLHSSIESTENDSLIHRDGYQCSNRGRNCRWSVKAAFVAIVATCIWNDRGGDQDWWELFTNLTRHGVACCVRWSTIRGHLRHPSSRISNASTNPHFELLEYSRSRTYLRITVQQLVFNSARSTSTDKMADTEAQPLPPRQVIYCGGALYTWWGGNGNMLIWGM